MKKYYAVAKDREIGIYTNWEETKKQVDGFSGAIHKSFKSREEAEKFMKDQFDQEMQGVNHV